MTHDWDSKTLSPTTGRHACTHLVQCYQTDETTLVQNAARFLKDGIERGHCLIVVATPSHRTALVRELKGIDAISRPGWLRGGLILLDAADTLNRILVAGEPDAARFDETIGTMVRAAAERNGATGVRVYGDMVGELWKAKRYAAAAHLENLWNDLRTEIDFDLFCAYPIGIFAEPFGKDAVDALLRTHTRLLPTYREGLEAALHQAFDEIVGSHGGTLAHRASEIREPTWASLPDAEALIIWLRHAMPDDAQAILTRAERYYRAAS